METMNPTHLLIILSNHAIHAVISHYCTRSLMSRSFVVLKVTWLEVLLYYHAVTCYQVTTAGKWFVQFPKIVKWNALNPEQGKFIFTGKL